MKFTNTKIFYWVVCLLLAFPAIGAYAHVPTTTPPDCRLTPPTNLTFTNVGINSVTATWTPVPGAVLYKVTVLNRKTNLIIATLYTPNTTLVINGLPSNTPLRIGVSASSCNIQDPARFGPETTGEVRTLKYIVAEVVVGKCVLPYSHSAPWIKFNEPIPINMTSNPHWNYYQARVMGKGNNADWSCSFSIVVTCTDNDAGAGFYVFVDRKDMQNITYSIPNTPLEAVQFRHQSGAVLFTLSKAAILSGANATTANTDISFASPLPAGITITSFTSSRGTTCSQPPPADFYCQGGDSGFDAGQDRDAQGEYSAVSDYTTSLAPNPTSDRVDLRFQLAAASEVDVNLYDTAGRLVQQAAQQVTLPEGENQLSMDVSTLPPGFYFVQLRTAQGMETLTLVKQ